CGSVGIAGVQTGIYPAETPGGWRLIGRTPVRPFDPLRADPFLMKAGDAVEFYAIDRAEFDRLERDATAPGHQHGAVPAAGDASGSWNRQGRGGAWGGPPCWPPSRRRGGGGGRGAGGRSAGRRGPAHT